MSKSWQYVRLDRIFGGQRVIGRIAASLSGILVHRSEILFFEVGMLIQYFLFRHASSKPSQHIPDSDAESPNARFAAPLGLARP